MEFLHSNYPPVNSKCNTFKKLFYELLPKTTELNIAVGYITADSLIDIKKLLEFNKLQKLNLTIGMHYIDRFTKKEYNAAMELNKFLCENERGEVRLVTPFRYHGKLYSYSDLQGPFAGIIGSNNLSSITSKGVGPYESSIFIDDKKLAAEMHNFIRRLMSDATDNIADLQISSFNEKNELLEGHECVKKVDAFALAECLSACTSTSFEIPIKGYEKAPKSNLNVYFGEGRLSPNGIVKPRHWYEVELIVPKEITSQKGYPQAKTIDAVFDVITDDGWMFKCKVSGTDSKNLRSDDDLLILGKWLKGRLENAGVLTIGEPVRNDTLKKYGRNSFTLTKTTIPGLWYLDFGVSK